jgi:hypothetical protein
MPKESFVEAIRSNIEESSTTGWTLMQQVGRLYDKLCIPGADTMPDDPIMASPEMDVPSAMWAQISSVQGQAEQGGTHHDYADAIAVTLVATASVLSDLPVDDNNVREFMRLTDLTPQQFLEIYA